MSPVRESLYVVIIAGGRGTRFWPRSRRHTPKQCLPVDGEVSLLEATIRRVKALVPSERILVITAADMVDSIRENVLDLPSENVLVEPEGRNTAPCVGWGAVEVNRRMQGESAVMAVLPADHLITREERFVEQLEDCAEAAQATGALVTIGVPPDRPETGFGYLEVGHSSGQFGGSEFLQVSRFVEKPDRSTAQGYLDGGKHLWNAGMFVFTTEAVEKAFRAYLPSSWAVLEEIGQRPSEVARLYSGLEKISVDYGIMERSEHVLTVRAKFGWSDVGSWTALGEHLPVSELGKALVDGAVSIGSDNNVVYAPGKTVAMVGVSDLVVVDTGDAILVCRKSDAQAVKDVVSKLEERGEDHLL